MSIYYLSGPMSGLPEFNRPAFMQGAAWLRGIGLNVVNPAEFDEDQTKSWHHYMRKDVKALCDCTDIVVLSGWENSRGASLEVFIATQLGLNFYRIEDLIRC